MTGFDMPTGVSWSLWNACVCGDLKGVQDATSKGADIHNDIEELGQRPINIACREGHLSVVKWLHHEGVALNARNGDGGGMALHDACHGGHIAIAQWLHHAGASIDTVDDEGMQPLHHACECGHLQVVQWLCDLGASLDVIDRDKLTPVARAHHFAREDPSAENYQHVLDFLAAGLFGKAMLSTPTASARPHLLGRCVRIHGLSARVELNDKHGVAQVFHASKGRYGVLLLEKQYGDRLANGRRIMGEWVHVRPANLELVEAHQAGEAASLRAFARLGLSEVQADGSEVQADGSEVQAAEGRSEVRSEGEVQAEGSDVQTETSHSERMMRAKATKAKREAAKAKDKGTAAFLTAAELHEAELKSAAAAAALLAEELDVDAHQTGLKKAKKAKKAKAKKKHGADNAATEGSVSAPPTVEEAEAVHEALHNTNISNYHSWTITSPPAMLEEWQAPTSAPRPPQMASCVGVDVAQPTLTLADVGDITDRDEAPESTIGGETTCIVCMLNPKSHLAAPCGHQCACGTCAAKMKLCPYCRAPVQMWVQHRMIVTIWSNQLKKYVWVWCDCWGCCAMVANSPPKGMEVPGSRVCGRACVMACVQNKKYAMASELRSHFTDGRWP
eukprot:2091899-Prymnesium_polylepis.1